MGREDNKSNKNAELINVKQNTSCEYIVDSLTNEIDIYNELLIKLYDKIGSIKIICDNGENNIAEKELQSRCFVEQVNKLLIELNHNNNNLEKIITHLNTII